MPPEIIALIEKPHLLIAILLVGALAGISLEQFRSKMRRQAWRDRNRWRWDRNRSGSKMATTPWVLRSDLAAGPAQFDAADQLRTVMSASFTTQPLLNKSEARVFKEVDVS